MATTRRLLRTGEAPKTKGEDAAMVLGLLVAGGFAFAVATLLLLELLAALPDMLSFLVVVSLMAATVMLVRAVIEKITALPAHAPDGPAPILRHLRNI